MSAGSRASQRWAKFVFKYCRDRERGERGGREGGEREGGEGGEGRREREERRGIAREETRGIAIEETRGIARREREGRGGEKDGFKMEKCGFYMWRFLY